MHKYLDKDLLSSNLVEKGSKNCQFLKEEAKEILTKH